MWTLASALGMNSTYDVTSLTQVDSRRSLIIKEDSRPTGTIFGVPEDAEDDSDPLRPRFGALGLKDGGRLTAWRLLLQRHVTKGRPVAG